MIKTILQGTVKGELNRERGGMATYKTGQDLSLTCLSEQLKIQ